MSRQNLATHIFIAHIEHYTKGLENSLGLFSQVVGWMPSSIILDAPMGYDPMFGDEKLCLCGHPYYRHFDSRSKPRFASYWETTTTMPTPC